MTHPINYQVMPGKQNIMTRACNLKEGHRFRFSETGPRFRVRIITAHKLWYSPIRYGGQWLEMGKNNQQWIVVEPEPVKVIESEPIKVIKMRKMKKNVSPDFGHLATNHRVMNGKNNL